MSDCTANILHSIAMALEQNSPLCIRGGGSKTHILGRNSESNELPVLDISSHCGIVDYNPGELVLTARAGTAITELKAALAKEGQMLAFEPPEFGGKATLGGTLACNISGPGRPWGGSVRDAVLGIQLVNGAAELLNFGGQVMKNVAGYDVSRLQAGALGTLGVITQVSLKVMPVPEHSLTLGFEMPANDALSTMISRAAQPKPLSGACWFGGKLFLRLSGAEQAVTSTAARWGGEVLAEREQPWAELREFSHPFFAGNSPLWRFSHRPTAATTESLGPMLIDWGGAQRWVYGDQDRAELEHLAESAGGHVSLFAGGDRQGEVRHRANTLEKTLQQRLKQAFDPAGIFNPGRLYSWM